MAKSTPHNLVYLHRDRGYQFRDRDPDMEYLCDIIDKSGLPIHTICETVARASKGQYKTSPTTIYNWLNGKTRKPTNFTMHWVGYALGYERRWTKI